MSTFVPDLVSAMLTIMDSLESWCVMFLDTHMLIIIKSGAFIVLTAVTLIL